MTTESLPPPTGEEAVPHSATAASAAATSVGERIVYNNRRRSKKAKTIVLPSEHQALALFSKHAMTDNAVVLNVTTQSRQVCSNSANSLTHFTIWRIRLASQ